jgi:hypothetical protein
MGTQTGFMTELHPLAGIGLVVALQAPGVLATSATGSSAAGPGGFVQCGVIDLNRVVPETGYAYSLTYFAAAGDAAARGTGSPVVLLEDTLPLGPAHSLHDDIRRKGAGRYSHWGVGLYFSSSDNSDPRANGRAYSWGVPTGQTCPIQICGQVDMSQAKPDTGLGYFLKENFGFPGDSASKSGLSSLQLFEGSLALGPAHTLHRDIRTVGKGRYSHWGNSLFFSTSDNSDPRSNGRLYYFGGSCRKLADVRLTKVASAAPFYATFGSHNQRIVDNANGLFVAHLTRMYPGSTWAKGNPLDTQSDWQLLRSTDEGASFQEVYFGGRAATHVSPIVGADARGAVYVFEQHFTALTGEDATMLRFDPAARFRSPSRTRIPGMASDKFSAVYDPGRDVFYYIATSYGPGHSARMATISTSGAVQVTAPVVTQGSHGFLMYPLLRLDEHSNLYFAWTTQALPAINPYLYWDIHFMVSHDQGRSWTSTTGKSLTTPVVADGDGPADRVTLPDETGTHPWLSSFLPKDGMVYFSYKASQEVLRKHARRFNLPAGRFDVDEFPAFRGNALSVDGQGGFFLTRRNASGSLIYFVGESLKDERVVILASDDAGVTWFDYAVTPRRFTSLYSVSGARDIGPSGNLYALFTDLQTKDESLNANDVWFMQVKAE